MLLAILNGDAIAFKDAFGLVFMDIHSKWFFGLSKLAVFPTAAKAKA
jgi:hypothetical protein